MTEPGLHLKRKQKMRGFLNFPCSGTGLNFPNSNSLDPQFPLIYVQLTHLCFCCCKIIITQCFKIFLIPSSSLFPVSQMTLHPGFVSSLSFPFQGQIQEIQKEGAKEIVARVLPSPPPKKKKSFTFVEMLLTAF